MASSRCSSIPRPRPVTCVKQVVQLLVQGSSSWAVSRGDWCRGGALWPHIIHLSASSCPDCLARSVVNTIQAAAPATPVRSWWLLVDFQPGNLEIQDQDQSHVVWNKWFKAAPAELIPEVIGEGVGPCDLTSFTCQPVAVQIVWPETLSTLSRQQRQQLLCDPDEFLLIVNLVVLESKASHMC